MTKLETVAAAKQFRKDADELLQRMKEHRRELIACHSIDAKEGDPERFLDPQEVVAQHILSTRDLESCIMRQGMALKYIGNPDPYPESKNPENPVVEPTADGLKL
jgi:hypothetical protein